MAEDSLASTRRIYSLLEWKEMKEGRLLRSLLRCRPPQLLLMHKGEGNCEVIKFLSHEKLFRATEPGAVMEELPNHCAKTGDWAIKWLMKFNLGKYKVMCTGRK